MAQPSAALRLGVYSGWARDVTCPGDNITYEVVLTDPRRCTVESIPEKSFFHGGQPPWHLEGSWELDDGELVITVTKQDITGPRKDADLKLPVGADGRLSFRDTWCSWKGPPPEDDKLKVKQEELQRIAEENQRKTVELEAMREEQLAAAKAEEEELQKLRSEVQRQREQQEAEAAEAEAERTRLAEERREQEALLQRQKEELEALAKAKEEVQRNREEARRLQEEHQRELAEQQSILEAERQKVEEERLAREAERENRQAELEAQRAELQKQRQEVERQREEEEALRQAQAEQFQHLDEELRDRAENLVLTEQVLTQERQQIMKSRSSLAMVQAHVVASILEKKKGDEFLLDACDDEPEAEDAAAEPDTSREEAPDQGGADVWSMDWNAVAVDGKAGEAAPA
mmetsp:Transcript_147265/g.455539  ORF Transcript_147265/g.455539 Transcript_147265/m.455539 type:complete len:403 (-) Transcript_147265:55-1263(-)